MISVILITGLLAIVYFLKHQEKTTKTSYRTGILLLSISIGCVQEKSLFDLGRRLNSGSEDKPDNTDER